MIDPTKITNYNMNYSQLEEMIIFWLMVAGKTARVTAPLLDNFLTRLHAEYEMEDFLPFDVIRMYDEDNPGKLEERLTQSGFGCKTMKARGLRELIASNLNLSTCTVEDLEKIHGIAEKTSRCFMLHSRRDARYAGLDTHVKKWLVSLGYEMPKNPPKGKVYKQLEKVFLYWADKLKMTPAELDLAVWNAYSSGQTYEVAA